MITYVYDCRSHAHFCHHVIFKNKEMHRENFQEKHYNFSGRIDRPTASKVVDGLFKCPLGDE